MVNFVVAMTVALIASYPGQAFAKRACRIVVFDTANTAEAYSPQTFYRGETNAHYIVDQIYRSSFGYKVVALPAIVGVQFQTGREAFLDPPPDLAIVHRSTFNQRDTAKGDAGLVLLISASQPITKFLVYSRKADTDDVWAADTAEKARAIGRVRAIKLPVGDAWAKPASIASILNDAKALLPPAGCS